VRGDMEWVVREGRNEGSRMEGVKLQVADSWGEGVREVRG